MSDRHYAVGFLPMFLALCSASPTEHLELGQCLRTGNHLVKPVSNPSPLFDLCSPWSSKSCCSPETAIQAHNRVNHLAFDMNHCGPEAISEQCHREFVREMCYYSCDPYIKPWIVAPDRKNPSKERLMHVPMCQHDCNRWWEACKDSNTCVRNWRKHFQPSHSTIVNKCPDKSECKQIKDIYADASDFCETVWDSSWKVVPDSDLGVQLNFSTNPNQIIEMFYLTQHLGSKKAEPKSSLMWTVVVWIVVPVIACYVATKILYYIFARLLCRGCC